MFVPRALRLQGVKETEKRKRPPKKSSGVAETASDDALVQAMQQTTTNSAAPSPAAQPEIHSPSSIVSRETQPATTTASPEFLAQLVAGIELIFADYAHQDKDGAQWLQERYRTVDAEGKYIHLTAILDHPNISTLKPQATQALLRQALNENQSQTLELDGKGFYVRRHPSTYPAPFVPENSFSVCDDDGLSFWDQRTIYVEPHIRHMCKTPAKVAHWLKEHGQLRTKWLPIQAVHTLYNSCAFVVLSGSVMHEDQWKKWRANDRPENWKVMTKVENLRRTEEYAALVRESRAEVAAQRRLGRPMHEQVGRRPLQNAPGTNAAGDGEQATSRQKKRKMGSTAASAADNEAETEASNACGKQIEGHAIKRRG